MNQSRAFFVSLFFAIVGMLLVYVYIDQKEQDVVKENGDMVPVVVASKDIKEMEVIDADMLELVNVPKKFKNTKTFSNMKDLEGLVALVPLTKGDQLVQTSLAPKGAETGLATQIAANKRAISIEVTESSGVTKLIKAGDHVDIIGSISYPLPDGTKGNEIKTILQNVNVLAIGAIIQNNIPQVYETDPLTQKKIAVSGRGKTDYQTVTVEVTPEQAQVLLYAQAQGVLSLTLRNPVDRVESTVGTTTIDEVLGPDSKRGEAREKETQRILDEARRAEELARAARQQQQQAPAATAPAAGPRGPAYVDPLEAGGGVLE